MWSMKTRKNITNQKSGRHTDVALARLARLLAHQAARQIISETSKDQAQNHSALSSESKLGTGGKNG